MHLNISQLSELTGRERRRIAKRLKDLQYTAGEWGAMLYGISRGAALVYAVDNLEPARAEQARPAAQLQRESHLTISRHAFTV